MMRTNEKKGKEKGEINRRTRDDDDDEEEEEEERASNRRTTTSRSKRKKEASIDNDKFVDYLTLTTNQHTRTHSHQRMFEQNLKN
jgi:hypothetical protein